MRADLQKAEISCPGAKFLLLRGTFMRRDSLSRWDYIFDQLNENNVQSIKAKEAKDLIKKGYVGSIICCLVSPFPMRTSNLLAG